MDIKKNNEKERQFMDVVRNVKKEKMRGFAGKKYEKRLASFEGFIAKFQQALDNRDSTFFYYVNKKLMPFLDLLYKVGLVHSYQIVPKNVQFQHYHLSLSPNFDNRLLVVYVKESQSYALAWHTFRRVSLPSRQVSVQYPQILAKIKTAGAATIYVINTSKGLLTHKEALQHRIGGVIVCEIY